MAKKGGLEGAGRGETAAAKQSHVACALELHDEDLESVRAAVLLGCKSAVSIAHFPFETCIAALSVGRPASAPTSKLRNTASKRLREH